VSFFATVAAGISAAPHLSIRAGLALDAVVTLAASTWCIINFWRCRQAHCAVTGSGWAGLGLLEIAGLVLGRSLLHGDDGLAFVAVLVVGGANPRSLSGCEFAPWIPDTRAPS
jgi:hypothetical protein